MSFRFSSIYFEDTIVVINVSVTLLLSNNNLLKRYVNIIIITILVIVIINTKSLVNNVRLVTKLKNVHN